MKKLLSLLKEFTAEDIEEIEKNDRQFKALEKLYESFKGKEEEFFKLVLINALMSYQLQMKGEDYWEKFSEFFGRKRKVEDFEVFLKLYNRRFLSAKLKRLKKAVMCVSSLKIGKVNDAKKILNEIAKCMGQKENSKTIVFAIKMLNYAFKIVKGEELKGIEGIAIPLDSRIGKISKDKKFWEELSEKSGIPEIKLDAIFWICQNEEHLDCLPERLRIKLRKVREEIKI